ncbi:J domain-containing protein [Trinickia soli]|jgi:curved DNA-binding protein CbpA|uniref:J domain-containing protein n=1 Tax=Trinickia soli TaxID=380675 RepID=UPI0012510BCA|nr:J domain-containing protein [Paraburkholderia sp. T12-10]
MATLYETLGVHEAASDDEIKRAYRKAAMRAHPDRNKGREAAAHDAFQEIKEAYAILSDPAQRKVYDAVFAQEMSKLRGREEQEARARAERAERAAQAERERYEKYVALALRYSERGHNRDVVFGVLLGRGCDEALAARIADGVAALSASRSQAAAEGGEAGESAPREAPDSTSAVKDAVAPGRQSRSAARHEGLADSADEHTEAATHAGLFSTLWHGMFGIRP